MCVVAQVPELTRGRAWSACVCACVSTHALVCVYEPTPEQVERTSVNVYEHMLEQVQRVHT